jgi:hypothetical protein
VIFIGNLRVDIKVDLRVCGLKGSPVQGSPGFVN